LGVARAGAGFGISSGAAKKQNFIEKKVQPASRCTTKVSRRTFEPQSFYFPTCDDVKVQTPRLTSFGRRYFGFLPEESITKESVSGKEMTPESLCPDSGGRRLSSCDSYNPESQVSTASLVGLIY
jgi:hypothetical protein